MFDFTGIFGLARYEARLLRRTWKFWILVVLGFIYLVAINLYYSVLHNFFSGYSGTVGLLSAGLVLQIVYSQFNTLFGILLIWFSYDFMSKDRRHQVDGVLHSRPLSTFSLVWGKFLGVLIPSFSLALLLSLISIGLRFIPVFKLPFRLWPYLSQIFVLTLPAMACMIALVFFLTAVTRSRVAAIVICHAYVIIDMVMFISLGRWIRVEYTPLVDYSGYALTTFYSDLIGFTGYGPLLLQRGYVVALTLLMLALTAAFYPRLKQAGRVSRPVMATAAVCGMLAVIYLGFSLYTGHHQIVVRDQAKSEQEGLVERPQIEVTHYDIGLDLTAGRSLSAEARMTVLNPGDAPVDMLTFVLNSDLDVDGVSGPGGQPLDFERGPTVLSVSVPPLAPGEETEVTVAYHGRYSPFQPTLFLNSQLEVNEMKGQERNNVAVLGYLPAWVSRDCTFLVPQARWYPSPNVDYGYTYPDKHPANFSTSEVRVTVPPGILAVSQGGLAERTEAGQGNYTYHFVSDVPVPGLSVNAGDYVAVQGEVGGIRTALYYIERHASNVEFFMDARDDILEELTKRLEQIDEATGLDYPYPSLSLVEVPAAMRAYSEGWDSPNPMIQPGVVMLKEAGFFSANFERAFEQSKERAGEEEADPGKIKVDMLSLFFDLDLVSGSLVQNVMPSLWSFRLDASGPLYPLAGRCLDNYIREIATGFRPFRSVYAMKNLSQLIGEGIGARFSGGGQMAWQDAFYQSSQSLPKVYRTIDQKPLVDLTPDDEPELFYNVMNYKGRGFVMTLKEFLGEETFHRLLSELLARYQFQAYTLDDLRRTAEEVSDQDLGWFFDQWTESTVLPGYQVVEQKAFRLETGGEAPAYQVRVRVANREDAKGFAVLTLETRGDEVERRVLFDKKETVELALVVPDEPERLVINPIVARNKGPIRQSFRIPEEPVSADPLEYVEPVTSEGGEGPGVLTVIVDDQDSGFALQGEPDKSFFRQRARRDDDDDSVPEYRFGVPGAWENWTRSDDSAYGLYNRTLKIKGGGEGEYSATWTASLPERGRWEVFVYIGVTGENIRARENRKLGSNYLYTIEHEDGTEEVTFDATGAEKGWNSLGEFYFSPDSDAVVTLTDKADGPVVADAVKFEYREKTTDAEAADPENADQGATDR